MPVWIEAGAWGLIAGSALVIGAAVAWYVSVPRNVVASVMAFGSGVLISALAFDLVDEAEQSAGLIPTVWGFLAGAVVFMVANVWLARAGARHRKRSGDLQHSEASRPGSGIAIAVGALVDGIPESLVLGLALLASDGVGAPLVAAIFISNLPEGLSSAAGMKRNGRSAKYVFGVWGGIALASGIAGLLGALLFQGASVAAIAFITAMGAGAILAMVADTMIPEAFEQTHLYAGMLAAVGFLCAFALSRSG